MGVFFPTLLILLTFSIHSSAQNLGFRCTNETTCNSLIDYKLPNTTTLSAIRNLFEIKNLRSLLAANNLSITTPQNQTFPASQILKIPFPCFCRNGTGISNRRPIYTVVPADGLYHIAAEVFSNLVTFPQIQTVNNIVDENNISIGQKVWIPLPCSCDAVGGDTVVHYGHLVAAGNTVSGIAQEFNTTENTLLDLNGMSNSADLKADSIIDVPLKGRRQSNIDDIGCTEKITGGISNLMFLLQTILLIRFDPLLLPHSSLEISYLFIAIQTHGPLRSHLMSGKRTISQSRVLMLLTNELKSLLLLPTLLIGGLDQSYLCILFNWYSGVTTVAEGEVHMDT